MSTPFQTTTAPVKQATERSINYARDLMLDKAAHQGETEAGAAEKIAKYFDEPREQKTVSDIIMRLKGEGYTGRKYNFKEPAVSAPGCEIPDITVVPEGRYALPTKEGAINEIAFYKVDRPTEGRWAGSIFVKRLEGPNEIGLGKIASHAMITRIAEYGAAESMALYGHQIGRCGMCHLPLTNDESRARGIGPVCAAKLDW